MMPLPTGALERIRLAPTSWLRTIRSRLYLAFGAAAALTVLGSLFALAASVTILTTLTEIVSRSMPAMIESFRLSEDTNNLIGSAPRLMAVQTEGRRVEIVRDIEAHSRIMAGRIHRLRTLDASRSGDIAAAHGAMEERLNALASAVADRIKISERRRALAAAVHKSHEALLEVITPAIDDANFDLMIKSHAESKAELNGAIDALRRLLQIEADANLLAGLLIESSMVTDIANLTPISDLIASAQRSIDGNLKALPNPVQRAKIAGLYGKLAALAGNSGILVQRVSELKGERTAQQDYASALAEAAKLRAAVENLVQHQSRVAEMLSVHAISQINVGRVILILLSVAASIGAALIAWLYVGRNVSGRLTALGGAMGRIATGEAEVVVPLGGEDEIAGMAQTLLVFRQAIADVSLARQSDAERARESEARRQEIETATREFERAVNEIVQALDHASNTMDGCAQVMAEAASNNQMQADASATASEQVTTNVSNVAMAAEEIAKSVEQISGQACASAEIARRASGEGKSIISTVERLATTVGQIHSVSNLIRGVAAQTNLLALNATIEAARAGAAGRGFAVVAQEVKTLAAQTERATGDITRQIFSIEVTTSNVVQAMKAIVGTIAQLDENANEISVAVQQQDAVSKEIARSANVAAERTREVSASVVEVSGAAGKTSEVAKAVLNAGSELAEKSGRLRAEVERFLAKVRVA